jgi:creatinine amidohydrolase
MPDYILAEQTHAFIRSQQWQVAVLPFGATEPHNFHMPYGTDNFEVDVIGRKACAYAYERGARVLLLPTMPFGVNTNYVTPTTLLKLITDLTDSLERQGLRKLVLLNGHGGNELKPFLRELHHRTGVFLCLCDWYRMAVDRYREIFQQPGEHADEVETSLGLAFFPELLKMDQAGKGATRPTRFEAVEKGWIGITRPWHLATEDTGMGNPAAASADKGRRLMEILVERLGSFLVDLAAAPLDERFPY